MEKGRKEEVRSQESGVRSDAAWVDARFQALGPAGGFQPDATRARARLRTREAGAKRMQQGIWQWRWAAAGGLSLCLALATLPAPRATAQRVLERVFAMHVDQPFERPPAPDFALLDANGNTVRLSDYRGKVVLLNFWATWCMPCRREIPWFVDLASANKDRGFVVLGVSVDEQGWAAVKPYLAEYRVNYPVAVAQPGALPEPYRSIQALPQTYLIDRDGQIAGEYDSLASKAAYERWVGTLLESPQPAR